MDALVNPELREDLNDCPIKVENLAKQVIFKGLAPRVILSNHFLPKGTKAKVNLEEQGRQKVSFSFAQTKKTRQNVFLPPPSSEKSTSEHSLLQAGTLPTSDIAAQSDETKNVDTHSPALCESKATHLSVSFPLKSKQDLGKLHFKKQILSVTVVDDNAIVSTTSADISIPVIPSESDKIRSSAKVETESSLQQSHKNSIIDSSSEKYLKEEKPQEKLDSCLKGPVSSHIGKEDADCSIFSDHEDCRKSQPRSDSTLQGSESDGDSIRTSSSQKSSGCKNFVKKECQSKETKRSYNSKTEESQKSRSDRKDDDNWSSRSKSERDSRHISSRSSRSDRDRRRTRSRSRSRSRGNQTSSYSRSERSRSVRQSRVDRSHYHDSERRFHRISPHRERRNLRTRTDGWSRDSSDSEDDHRWTRNRGSDSSRSSTYSCLQKDSKSSTHSKFHRDSKPTDCSRVREQLESDKRSQHSKSERSTGRSGDTESNKKSSPEAETVNTKPSAHSKSYINAKISNSNSATSSRTLEKKVQKNSGSSDSDEEDRRKSQTHVSDRSSGSGTLSYRKTDSTYQKNLNKVTGTDRQSTDRLSNNTKQSQLVSSQVVPQRECSRVDSEPLCDNSSQPTSKHSSQQMHEDWHKLSLVKTQQTQHQHPNQELCSFGKSTNGPESHKTVETLKESSYLTSRSLKVGSSTEIDPPVKQSDALTEEQTEPFCAGHTPGQDSVESLADSLSVKELAPGGFLKLNTKLDGSSLIISKIKTPVTPSLEYCEKDPKQLNVKPEQPNSGNVKKDGSSKKSRWDIVGHDASESKSDDQSSKKTLSPEVTSLKKLISEKKIEFSNDTNPDESYTQKPDSEVHSKKSVEHKRDLTSVELSGKIISQPSDLGTQHNHDEHTVKPLVNQTVEITQSKSVLVACDHLKCSSINEQISSVDKPKPKTRNPGSLNLHGKFRSEDSESEDSDSDSDDGQASLKRLHSVVIVPKNSTIAIETEVTEPSPGVSVFLGQQESIVQMVGTDEGIKREFAYGFNFQSKLEKSSAALFKVGEQTSMQSKDVKCQSTCSANVSYQSQSNMIDSTSHSEATYYPHVGNYWSAQERPNVCAQLNQASVQNLEKPCRKSESAHHQYLDGIDSWNRRKGRKQLYGDFDEFSGGKGFNLVFNQSEQPSTTFQQPDSSHGTERLLQPGIISVESIHGQGTWAQPMISNVSRPFNTYVPFQYHDSVNQIHPDSLTNDHDEDSQGRLMGIKRQYFPPGSTPFVQAHEINSNGCFNTESQNIFEAPREENQKSHRGRGPPKKRHQEFESESDNEAEVGLTSKRECLDETSRGAKTQDARRPLLSLKDFLDPYVWREKAKQKKMPPYFDLIEENLYLTERKKNKSHRDIKRMQCECAILSREERARGIMACGEDCLNRLLMIECSSRCLNGAYCCNRRFQMKQHADFEVILTESKGWGLRSAKDLQANTFVLEYCGEVLDHREFKARVKEYARNKNIHYYFMALKNNEIIDATLKGNCSRFMNHSCEPNCETQKWTVNGQLRVGFFTTKAVPARTELTFDYQFQRYGKEAQKCFCGAPSCRGLIGGETRVSVRAAGGKKQKERSRKKDTDSGLTTLDEELEALQENGEGLFGEKDVISLCRLMVRVETMEQRLTCLKLLKTTQNPLCLKQFLDHHGLSLLWIFMVELSEAKSNSVNHVKLQLEIMNALAVLPISTKNMLEESRVLQFIQRWAQSRPLSQPAEQDGYSSESTSRAQTPLNTPDVPPAKLATEMDKDTPKRAGYHRLKIISENSLDSALSDASKASDGKEEEDEEVEEMEEESSQLEPTIERSVKVESIKAPAEIQTEVEPMLKEETPEAVELTLSKPEAMVGEEEALKTQEPEELLEEPKSQELVGDPKSQELVGQPKSQELVGEPECQELVGEPESQELVVEPESQELVVEPESQELVVEPDRQELMVEPESQELVVEPDRQELVVEPDRQELVVEPDRKELVVEPDRQELVVEPESQQRVGEPESQERVGEPESQERVEEPESQERVGETESQERVGEPESQELVGEPESEKLSMKPEFQTVTMGKHSEVRDIKIMEDISNADVVTEVQVENASSEQCSSAKNTSSTNAEMTPTQSEVIMESISSGTTPVAKESTSTESPAVSVETTPSGSAAVSTENTSSQAGIAAGSADALAMGTLAVPTEGTAVGTPSQDEEEAVSDVESERSQEPPIRASDISDMAARLLDSWKDLKEVYRIPKKSQVEKESNDRSRDREAVMNPWTPSSSRERERERERERDREWDRDRDWERELDWDRERDGERSTLRSADRKRRRGSTSPLPPLAYEWSNRRNDDRYEQANSSKKKLHTKEPRNKLSTEERRKLFEQEVAQREVQKHHQQQQLQTLAFNPLVYTSSPSFMNYPPGYPIQSYVDPTNPNVGKVLLPTPAVEPLCATSVAGGAAVNFEQIPTQPIISDLGLASPSSTTQAGPTSSLAHIPAALELSSGTQTQHFVQPAVPAQDMSVAILSMPAQTASPQVQSQQGYTTLWDPNTQQAVTVQTQPTQQYSTIAQPQTAIYYQGQPCQTIYSIPAGYPQTNTPVIQTYTEPAASFLHGQPVYTAHQQGVVVQQGGTVTTIVTSQTVQQEMIVPNSIIDLPPPSPPKPKTIILPPSWKVARDPEGRIYYFHIITRQTQWDPPSWDGAAEEASLEHEAEMDLGTPTYDENPSKFSTKTAEADTSSELAKKSKEVFRKEMSQFIVQCLNPFRKPDCKLGRISNTDDFKHLARKLTHGVMNKELKSCKNPEDLECNENVKHKTKEYIKKYMQKFGSVYRPKEDTELD
ncbi:histone-lysine N-methyltransferase SETD2-like [Xyrauchen texanus]|uniref:histone-lysine N-methyltransferase SETD2-like n=1 Tax=Xyrauchen texanus TaxID=154827 RepID=UPI0022419F89|nr:histone-lysine N-methyltransferase SETD2-like [Xyrauchen texanus]XP_052002923.1 histone-lysine N-methyltransferase SETD2-like [Xyrauchen texanus]